MKIQWIVRAVLVALLCFFSFSILQGVSPAASESRVKEDCNTLSYGQGSVTYVEGVPHITLSGSPYEMGKQYGVLLKEELQGMYGELEEYLAQGRQQQPWYIRPFYSLLLNRELRRLGEDLPQEFQEELQGVSSGSGISYNRLLFGAFGTDLLDLSCTGALLRDDAGLILARNLDFSPPFLGRYPVVVTFKPQEGYASTMVGVVGFLGVLTGINEKGLMASINKITFLEGKDTADPPIGYMLRSVFQEAQNLEEVDPFFQNYTSRDGWLILMGSQEENEGVLYELAGGEYTVTALEGEYLHVSNHFLKEEWNYQYTSLSYSQGSSNQGRQERMASLLEDLPSYEPHLLIPVLADTEFYGYSEEVAGLNYTINNHATLQSVILHPPHQLYFSSDTAYAGYSQYYVYDFPTGTMHPLYQTYEQEREDRRPYENWYRKVLQSYQSQEFTSLLKEKTIELIPLGILARGSVARDLEEKGYLTHDTVVGMLQYTVEDMDDLALPYIQKAEFLLARDENPQQARMLLEKALQAPVLYPDLEAAARAGLAQALYHLGETEEAQIHAQMAREMVEAFAIQGPVENHLLSRLEEIGL